MEVFVYLGHVEQVIKFTKGRFSIDTVYHIYHLYWYMYIDIYFFLAKISHCHVRLSTGTSCIPRRCQLVPHPGLALLSSKRALHGPVHLPMSFTSIRVLIIKWVKSQSLIPALYPIIKSLESPNEDVHNKNHPQEKSSCKQNNAYKQSSPSWAWKWKSRPNQFNICGEILFTN